MNIKDANLSGGCHIVILGAGASIASNLRNPELHGLELPSMNNLPDVVGLNKILSKFPKGQDTKQRNFNFSRQIQIEIKEGIYLGRWLKRQPYKK